MATDDDLLQRAHLARSHHPSPGEISDDPGPKLRNVQPIGVTLRRPGPPRSEPEPVVDEDEPESFDPESKDYKAVGRAGKRTVPGLRLILKDGTEHGCQYADLDSAHPGGSVFIPSAPGKANIIKLRFAGKSSDFCAILEGVRLRKGWEQIMAQLTPWVHELPASVDFKGGDDPVIRSIRFELVPAITPNAAGPSER